MRKKLLRKLSLYTLVFLLFCTFVSVQMENIILPQVEVSDPVSGTVMTDGNAVEYAYTIPYSAVQQAGETYYAYHLQESNGRFGTEQRAIYMEINVIAHDDTRAALKAPGFYKIITNSNKPLEHDMLVKNTTLEYTTHK